MNTGLLGIEGDDGVALQQDGPGAHLQGREAALAGQLRDPLAIGLRVVLHRHLEEGRGATPQI